MKIQDIADFAALSQLARALWGEGAAVFVGAGFSRNAERASLDTPEPPLWQEIAEQIYSRLYPGKTQDRSLDPLKLAEEFRSYFGQSSLDDFVRARICDSAWQPGPLHKALLELPWSDVLTTNWDTLLERTARSVNDFYYQAVLSQGDLAHARAPRIIKLHGSIGTTDHFIIAEEDYRSYPRKFAAFVNCARQIFIENELCLVGFSGNDPNFIQWTGWVRDNLGGSSRHIYLVGCLNLTISKRKYLEDRNIAPIDFSSLVHDLDEEDAQAAALNIFFDFLAQSKPVPIYDWQPADLSQYAYSRQSPDDYERQLRNAEYARSLIDQAVEIWRSDRQNYPGWLICPAICRRHLSSTIRNVIPNKLYLENLPPVRTAEILYELVWRLTTAHVPIDQEFVPLLEKIADPGSPSGIARSQQLELAITLLRTARREANDERFERWDGVIEKYIQPGTDFYAELMYQRALKARDALDFVTLDKMKEFIVGPDPMWLVRRASLLFELGEFSRGERSINEALADLNKRQRDHRKSLWLLSRRAWVEWLARALRRDSFSTQREPRWPLDFKEARCDPQDELNFIADRASSQLQKRQEKAVTVIPLFEAGHYKDVSNETEFIFSPDPTPLDDLRVLAELAGLPKRLKYFDLIGQAGRDATELAFDAKVAFYLWFLRVNDGVDTRMFDRCFGRIAIAQLEENVVNGIRQRLRGAIDYWRGRIKKLSQEEVETARFAGGRLRSFIEAFARLTVRQSSAAAIQNFALAMDLGADHSFRNFSLFQSIGNLAKFSVEAVLPSDRQQIVLSALEFPLSAEFGIESFDAEEWPNPMVSLYDTIPYRPPDGIRWKKRILELIKASSGSRAGRHEALLRLAYLSLHKILTVEEDLELGNALWSKKDAEEPELPADTGLLLNTFAEFPAPNGIDAEKRVRGRLFGINVEQLLSPSRSTGMIDLMGPQIFLQSISQAAGRKKLLPTNEQAVALFDALVTWPSFSARSPHSELPIISGYLRRTNARIAQLIGDALAGSIIPSLSSSELNETRAKALLELIRKAHVFSAIEGLPYFAISRDDVFEQIVQTIRRAVSSTRFDEAVSGLLAVGKWAEFDQPRSQQALPGELVGQVLSSIATRQTTGLAALLYCCFRLLQRHRLVPNDITVLCQRLDELFIETAYDSVEPNSRGSVSVSLIRANCVRLCRALREAGSREPILSEWMDAAGSDPLPEVRFA